MIAPAEEALAPSRSSRPRPARRPSGTRRRGRWPASGCAGCRATSSTPGRARPRRRTSSRRRRRAARRRRCAGSVRLARRGVAAGPVPWIHCRCRSAGISLPTKSPSRASCTVMRGARECGAPGRGTRCGCRSRARAARRSMRADISAWRSSSSGASARRARRAPAACRRRRRCGQASADSSDGCDMGDSLPTTGLGPFRYASTRSLRAGRFAASTGVESLDGAVHVSPAAIGCDSVSVPELTRSPGRSGPRVAARHRRGELAEAQRGAAQRVLAAALRPPSRRSSSSWTLNAAAARPAPRVSSAIASGRADDERACRPGRDEIAGWNFQSGNTQSMISNPSAIHSTASSTAAASARDRRAALFSLKTISGSIFGEHMRADRQRRASLPSA